MRTPYDYDVVEIAAAVSEKVCDAFPSFTRVNHVLDDERTIVVAPAQHVGLNIESFWPEDCPLSAERKRSLFWQYHRSMSCHQYAAVLATVLKDLCDAGVRLGHDGNAVVDVLVLNTIEFDVSDLLAARGKNDAVLKVHDPVTGTTVPIISTHETMDRLIDLGESVCARLGMQLPPLEERRDREVLKRHRLESYVGTIPHWWIAVVVEGEKNGNKEYNMVHLDICGAAYDATALVKAPGSSGDELVSLQTFSTPEYSMVPNSDKNMRHKLVMKAFTSERSNQIRGHGNQHTLIVLQPKSVRHFRCYHKDDTSTIEVTPLATFVERNPFGDDYDAKISEMVLSIQRDAVLQLPVGSEVIVCNIKSKPELNGRSGIVHKSSIKDKVVSDRIPVLIKGLKAPLQLRATCIRLPVVKRQQYQTLEEKLADYNKTVAEEYKKAGVDEKDFSQKQKSQISGALDDPAVSKALAVIQTGQMAFTSFGDPEFKRGVEKFLRPPLDAVLPRSMMVILQNGYELSNQPKANDAIKLINIMKAGKQRFLQEHPDAANGDGSVSVPQGSEFMRIKLSVGKKIRSDEGLLFVFQRLEELGLYINPAK